MTQPEENLPKTTDTDQNLPDSKEQEGPRRAFEDNRTEMEAALRDEMERTNTSREDLTGE